MVRPKLEVADIFRRHGEAWRAANAGHLNLAQRRIMTAIEISRIPSSPASNWHSDDFQVGAISDGVDSRIAHKPSAQRGALTKPAPPMTRSMAAFADDALLKCMMLKIEQRAALAISEIGSSALRKAASRWVLSSLPK
jgi:hypothetical protein